MDFKSIAKQVAEMGLPILGTALGGPGGLLVGKALAAAIGSPSEAPEAILKSLTEDTKAKQAAIEFQATHDLELKKLDYSHEEKLEDTDTARLVTVNETMRAEAQSEHWAQWGWRPFIGFTFGLSFLVVSALCCWVAYEAVAVKDMTGINMVPQLVGAFATLFAIPGAVLGVASWWRGKGKAGSPQ